VVDSGPLIALFDRDDRHHPRAIEFLKGFRGELISNHAVLTEVCHLLDFSVQVQIDFLRWVVQGAIRLEVITAEDLHRVIQLTEKYSDLPMDFADASLVCLCERRDIRSVASVDRDFTVYRTSKGKPFRNVFFPR
jgi:predicted nucleic acid-binding protein